MLSRRGFLSTLAAASVGAVAFDPGSGLWVPGLPAVVPIRQALAEQLTLDELALKFARMMTDRLVNHPSVALREITYRLNGTVKLPTDTLLLEDGQAGRFASMTVRLVKTLRRENDPAALAEIADQMADDIFGTRVPIVGSAGEYQTIDTFAPIGINLRPGEPFSDGTLIGLGTDTRSGLSVRAIRNEGGRRGQWITSFEMAGGRWVPWKEPVDEPDYEPRWGASPRTIGAGQTGSYLTVNVDSGREDT